MSTVIRTIKFLARCYGVTPAFVEVTMNGTQLFSGNIATSSGEITDTAQFLNLAKSDFLDFCQVDVEVDPNNPNFSSPVVISVSNSSVLFGPHLINQIWQLNPELPESEVPPTALIDQTDELKANGTLILDPNTWRYSYPEGDSKANVKINNVLVVPERGFNPNGESQIGEWSWFVTAGSTMSYDLTFLNNI